jgi:hypothetical protein
VARSGSNRVKGKQMIRIGHRFMTGQICGTTGDYEFDGYTDSSLSPLLNDEEKHIAMSAGSAFPAASSGAKTAYWKFLGWN